jgi:hypothetical protein
MHITNGVEHSLNYIILLFRWRIFNTVRCDITDGKFALKVEKKLHIYSHFIFKVEPLSSIETRNVRVNCVGNYVESVSIAGILYYFLHVITKAKTFTCKTITQPQWDKLRRVY